MRRGIAALAVALAAAVALAGCVTIPTGGGVGTQRIVDDQGSDNNTVRAANPPRKGASPSEIVAGFVRAGGSPQGAYSVARQYLTDGNKWKPGAGIFVSDTTVAPFADAAAVGAQADYTVSLSVSGQIDASGVYSTQTPAEHDLRFHLVKQRGQWRIQNAPDGTVLRSRDLGVVAEPHELYFFDPGYQYLVPDLRWFVDQGSTSYIPGRIVGALLAGPSAYLASPVTASAFPAGTQIGDAPTLDAGTVTVDLSSGVLDAGTTQQSRMLTQLTWSLGAADVTRVTMTANGLQVPTTEPASAIGAPTAAYEAIGSDGKTFGAVTPSGLAAIATLGGAVQALAPTAVTLGRDRTTAAVLGTGGVSLVSGGGHPVVDARSGLLPPALDPDGWVWSAQADPGSLVVVRADGKQHPMPLGASGRIASIAISRDGTRLLVALAADTGARLLVLGVQRDKDGVPTGLGTPLELPVNAARPIIDAAWIDSGSVAIIAGDPDGQDAVTELQLGGQAVEHGSVRAGRTLASGDSGSGFLAMRVLLASGELDQPSVIGDWQATGAVLSLLGTQQ